MRVDSYIGRGKGDEERTLGLGGDEFADLIDTLQTGAHAGVGSRTGDAVHRSVRQGSRWRNYCWRVRLDL